VIFGAFDIHKPYFNVDADNVYTHLGSLQYRGLETSLSYSDGGLTVLTGGVYLQPRVDRVIPEPGATGNVPLGPVPLTVTANVDYAPQRWGPWAASLQWNRLSSRVATADNSIYLPAFSTLEAGVRYHWTLRSRPWTVRLDGFNLTDTHGLHVSSLYVVLPEQGLTVHADPCDGPIKQRREMLGARPEARQNARVLSLLPRAAELYRKQIEQGLDGDTQAASRARVILRDLLGEITLSPGEDGSLWASYAMQPAALLKGGAGTGGRGDRI
jgi:hypothetical protein